MPRSARSFAAPLALSIALFAGACKDSGHEATLALLRNRHSLVELVLPVIRAWRVNGSLHSLDTVASACDRLPASSFRSRTP
jgi:hypothetical protein